MTNVRGISQRVLRHGSLLWYTAAQLLLQSTGLICQFWVLRYVPPEQMGVWAFVALVESYLLITQLGIVNAMNREFPYFMGLGDREKALGIAANAQAYAWCNGAILGLVFVILSFVYGGRSPEWRLALLTAAATAPMDQYSSYLIGTYRSGAEFKRLSQINLVQAVVMACTLVLPVKLGFAGYCLRVFVLVLVPVTIGHAFRPLRVRPRFDRPSFVVLASTGWRLFLWSYFFRVAQSFPRLALATLSGTLYLGLFVPVTTAMASVTGIAGSLGAYLYPRLTRRVAQNRTGIGRTAIKAGAVAVLVLAGPVLLGILLLPWLVPAVVPAYTPAIGACQVALAAGLLECMTVATIAFAASKAWREMFTYLSWSLLIRAAGAFGGYYLLEDRLLGVACGMLIASAAMVVVTVITVARIAAPVAGEALSTVPVDQ